MTGYLSARVKGGGGIEQHARLRIASGRRGESTQAIKYAENILDLIGDTPLVKLNRMTDGRMATVLVRLENYNPSGSVKARMAWHMVRRAEEAGLLRPGATLVESTSGNTGLGLAMTAAIRGYRCACTMPDKMSKEKIDDENVAMVVEDADVVGVISKIDMVEFLAARS